VFKHLTLYKPEIILDIDSGSRKILTEAHVSLDCQKRKYIAVVADVHYLPFKNVRYACYVVRNSKVNDY